MHDLVYLGDDQGFVVRTGSTLDLVLRNEDGSSQLVTNVSHRSPENFSGWETEAERASRLDAEERAEFERTPTVGQFVRFAWSTNPGYFSAELVQVRPTRARIVRVKTPTRVELEVFEPETDFGPQSRPVGKLRTAEHVPRESETDGTFLSSRLAGYRDRWEFESESAIQVHQYDPKTIYARSSCVRCKTAIHEANTVELRPRLVFMAAQASLYPQVRTTPYAHVGIEKLEVCDQCMEQLVKFMKTTV